MRTFIFSLFCLFSFFVQAKTVHVEWEPIEDAKSYDLEWTKVPAPEGEKPFSVQVTAPSWAGSLQPGKYQMRVRSRDQRKVPGDWSSPEEFKVGLDTVKGHSPADAEIRNSEQSEMEAVTFKWEPVENAKSYSFQISSQDGSLEELHSTPVAELTLKLPVAKKYTWSVEAQADNGFVSEKSVSRSFTLIGKKLEDPAFNQADSVGALKWRPSAHAESYDVALFWRNPETGKWEHLDTVKDYKSTEIPFPKEWIGGEYAVQLKAKAPLRTASEMTYARFQVRDLNRAPAVENTFVLKKEIERRHGLYALAQQQLSTVDYSSTNTDRSQYGQFSALGAQTRVGVGSFNEGPWGILASAEFGGLYRDGHHYQSSSLELTGINRSNSDQGEVRHYFGISSKELPMLSSSNSTSYDVDHASVFGPHYGFEKNWILGTQAGLQASFHGYLNLFKLHTPNGEDVTPTPSVQLSLLGSYKLTPTATGYCGFTLRSDSISYRATDPSSVSNKIEVSGHYLNFYLEWAL